MATDLALSLLRVPGMRALLRQADALVRWSGIRGFDGAAVGRRTAGWKTATSSINTELLGANARLRSRARDLVRNDANVKRAVTSIVANTIGTGIRPRAATGDKERNKRIDALWERWGEQCFVEHDLDVYGIQRLAMQGMVEGGETLLRRRPRKLEDGLPVPLQVQVLEAELLDERRNEELPSGGRIVQGVEYDPLDRRNFYWLHARHPGEAWSESVRVAAGGLAHGFHMVRPGQARGFPWLSAIIMGARDLGDLRVAELMRRKMESCMVGVIQRPPSRDPKGGVDQVTDGDGNPVETMQPGTFLYAPDQIAFNHPASVGGAAEYERMQLQNLGAGVDTPYDVISGDMSQANFSSLRAGRNEYYAFLGQVQWLTVIPLVCRPLWRWFVDMSQAMGLIEPDPVPVEWDTPGFASVNPLQDIQADILAVRAGAMTLGQMIAKRGYNPIEVLEELARWNALLDELKLVLDSDPRRTQKAGGVQVSDPIGELTPAA